VPPLKEILMLHSKARFTAILLTLLTILAGPLSAAPLARPDVSAFEVPLLVRLWDYIQAALWGTSANLTGAPEAAQEPAPFPGPIDNLEEGCGIDPSGGRCIK
jgi:hypothetical protein